MPTVAQYGVTLLLIAAMAAFIGVLDSDWGLLRSISIENPGTPFIIVVVGAAVAFGIGPAFAAIVASYAVIAVFFRAQENPQRLVVLLVTMLLVVILADRQRQARERARRAEVRLRAVLESMSDAVILIDVAKQPEDLNEAARMMLDAPDHAAALTAITHEMRDERQRGVTPLLYRALAGETDIRDETTLRFGDGAERIVNSVANPVRDAAGRIIGAVSVRRDVTEATRQTEERERLLARHAAELETIISSLPDAVAIGDAEGHVLQMNAAARRLLGTDTPVGHDAESVVTTFTVRHVDGTGIDPRELPIARAARGETFSGQEILITTPNGETFISCSGAPIRDAAGAITGTVVVWGDITERKRAEGLMTRLGRIVDTSSNEVYVLDSRTFGIVQTNEGARRSLGYTPEELRARTLLDLAPGLSDETLEMLVAPLRTDEESELVYELQFARADGTIYPVEMQLYLSRAEMPPVFIAIVQDITERHAAVRQREALFREIAERQRFAQTVIEAAPAGIAVFGVDDAFTVRIANEQYLQLLHEPWRTEGIVGSPARAFMPDAEATGILTIYRQVCESGNAVLLREFAYAGFARDSAYYDWSVVPLREDGAHVTGLLLLIVDVTERVRSRQRIEELAWDAAQRANELETTIAAITDGVIVIDATGQITLENAASQRLLGHDHLAMRVNEGRQAADPQPRSVFADRMPLARALTGETVVDQVLLIGGADSERTRYLLCSSAPVRAMDEVITGAVAIFRDITALKQVEQLKDEFVSVAAHELRTPLTAIKGYAELLERRLGREPERARERHSLAVIRKQTDRLTRLVNEMLDVSRVEGGRLQLNCAPFDLTALVEETLNNIRVSNDSYAFVLDAAPKVEVFADAARIEQVLINLLTNAVTYSPDGSTVTLSLRRDEGQAVVAVRDQGIGIAPEEVPHLFSRFYRAPEAGTIRSGGMGLGLYISREIVERHGGTIAVESEPGVGSTFLFTVPLTNTARPGEET